MTSDEAAAWMRGQVESEDILYQSTAAAELEAMGDGLVFWDDEGNLCIEKRVLTAFRKLTPDFVFERSGKFWRRREPHDLPGRQQ